MLLVVLMLFSFLIVSDVYATDLPLWLFEPADVSKKGALGFAAESWKGDEYSLLLAKCRALRSYLLLKGHRDNIRCPSPFDELTTEQLKQLEKEINEKAKEEKLKFISKIIKLKNYPTRIFLAYAYTQERVSFSYASESFPCSLENCKPSYLCNPLSEGYLASIGVAPISFSFQKQYQGAIENAIENLFLLLDTEVALKELELKNSISGLSSFSIYLNDSKVLPKKGRNTIKLVVRGICIDAKGNLFVYLIAPDLPLKKFHFSIPPCWIKEPGCVNKPLSVGIAKRSVGGIKTQIGISLRKAIVELAKIQGVNVIHFDFEKGKILHTGTMMETNHRISAALVGMYFDGNLLFTAISPLNSLNRRNGK